MQPKTSWTCLLASALLIPVSLSCASPPAVAAPSYVTSSQPQLVWDGIDLTSQAKPVMKDELLYAPLRLILEKMGYTLSWDETDQAIIANGLGIHVLHQPRTSTWMVNGIVHTLNRPTYLDEQGRAWFPLQPVLELLDVHLRWNPLSQTMYLKPGLHAVINRSLHADGSRISYKGQLAEGQREGSGKLFLDGQLWYDGSFQSGQMSGFGRLYEDGTMRYEGHFEADLPSGQGTYYDVNGQKYIGSFANGRRSGQGTLFAASEQPIYRGQWRNGVMNGIGELYGTTGKLEYSGEVQSGAKFGRGIAYDPNGNGQIVYDGQWKNNQRHGKGTEYAEGKLSFIGTWVSDKKDGDGFQYRVQPMDWYTNDPEKGYMKRTEPTTLITEVRYLSGDLVHKGRELAYLGAVKDDGTPHGEGRFSLSRDPVLSPAGVVTSFTLLYEGDVKNGLQTGKGRLYDDNEKLIYEGEVVNGKRQGFGQAYADGLLIYDGYWNGDAKHGTGRTYVYDHSLDSGYYTGKTGAYLYESRYEQGSKVEDLAVYRFYGSYTNGRPHGTGTLSFIHDYVRSSGPKLLGIEGARGWLVYEGDYRNGVREGAGKLYENNVLVYSGEFVNGVREGQGRAWISMDMIYTGSFSKDMKNGTGKIENGSGTIIYEGGFVDDKKQGTGKLYYSTGKLQYEGDFYNDMKDGYGKLYGGDGVTVLYQGEFRRDLTLQEYHRRNP